MRRFLPLLVIAGAVLLIVFGYRFLAQPKPGAQPGAGQRPATVVEAATIAPEPLPSTFETVGSLIADEAVVIRPEVVGAIEKIHFNEGERVEAGKLLFTLDGALTEADLNEAKANLESSQRAYRRALELAGRHLISSADLDTATATLGVDRARAASARTRLAKTLIRAPFDGVLGLREVSVGEYVSAGQALISLVRLDPIELDLRVPEVVLSRLALGQQVQVVVDAYRSDIFNGEIVAIAPSVDPASRSVALRARLANGDGRLRPGMSVRASIELGNSGTALLVPEQAIWPQGEAKMVYRIEQGVAHLVPVTLGTRLPGRVEVVSGLKPGDIVVTSGQLKIGDGAPVRIADSPTPESELGE
ncbi:MAG: efflux RND transporter periplasmic adaptor subunit [Lysobacterales bacterium]